MSYGAIKEELREDTDEQIRICTPVTTDTPTEDIESALPEGGEVVVNCKAYNCREWSPTGRECLYKEYERGEDVMWIGTM